ncbi:MAG TPA: methyltransferase domain-containing protein [Vicinamibacterales bacterium]|nr:methyltransferase domain-containing protein [Vicinamibacterales bacterium]
MLKLFRGAAETPHRAAVSMVGARPGDSVLFCGAGRPDLAGAVGVVTGLNGQTTVVDRQDGAKTRVAAGAAAAGALVDFEDAPLTMLPFDNGRWDVVVIVDGLQALGGTATTVLGESVRVVRPGGRVVVIDRVSRPGLFGLFRTAEASLVPAETITATLSAAGLRGVRMLAEVDGVRYFEGTKIAGG